jgi:hypothetical protein
MYALYTKTFQGDQLLFKMTARGRAGDVNKTQSERDSEAFHFKVIHALSLTIFSENGAEAAAALHELLRWSVSGPRDFPQLPANSSPPYPQATPCLVSSLSHFISLHSKRWVPGPTAEPAFTALSILSNLVSLPDSDFSIKNACQIGAIPESLMLLHRLSFDPRSPLARMAQSVLIQIGRFCLIEHTLKDHEMDAFVETMSSLFLLADLDSDDAPIHIFLNFALLDRNCGRFVAHIGADPLCRRFTQLLSTPAGQFRDFVLETMYAIVMTNSEVRDAVCNCQGLLRALLGLAIPPSEPYEARSVVSFTPYQKACVFLLELCEDRRVLAYLSRFQQQIAVAMLKWKSFGLPQLALKLSNAAPA